MARSKVTKAKNLRQPAPRKQQQQKQKPVAEKKLLVLPAAFPVAKDHISFMIDLVRNKDKYDEDIGTLVSRAFHCEADHVILMQELFEAYFNETKKNSIYQELLTIIIRHDHGRDSDIWSWICIGLGRLIQYEACDPKPGPAFRGLGKLMTLLCDPLTQFRDLGLTLFELQLQLNKILMQHLSGYRDHLGVVGRALETIAVFKTQ